MSKSTSKDDQRRESLPTDAAPASETTAQNADAEHFTSMADWLLRRFGPVLTTAEAAETLRCHPSHVRALCQEGTLRAVRVGERWKVPAAALAAMIEGEA